MSAKDEALQLFERYNCAQSVLCACCGKELGEDTALRLAASFGGGIGRTGGICGALSGGLMALGIREGAAMASHPEEAKITYYARVRQLLRAFKQRHSSIYCGALTGCDLTTPEGSAEFLQRDLHHSKCALLVTSVVEMLEETATPPRK